MNRTIEVIHRFLLFFSPQRETLHHREADINSYHEEVQNKFANIRRAFLPQSRLGIIFCSITFLIIITLSDLYAQLSFTTSEINSEFSRGMELFNKEKYPAAIRLFDSYINGNDKSNLILITEAEYFSAISSLKLFNSDAEHRMVIFISKHPESPRINESWLALGDYFYQNKNFRRAVKYYESVNRQELDDIRLAEYFFRLGYSLYLTGDKPRALLMFSEIKDIDTEYTPPAIYYYSQIAYEDKMYQTAMDGFVRLREDETFGGVVPFYIVQILYLQKDYDGILEIAPELLESAGKERSVELYRFIADAYYNKENYKEALPFLEKYSGSAKASAREDKFQLGYSYYKTGDLEKAIKVLLEIGAKNDILSQNVWNVLGDCYLQKGDKNRSKLAFGEASKMNFDKKIREESLFNYAKLTYELSYSPFGEAIASFQEYIELYPGSERIQEVYEYLVATFLQLKNYKAALAALDKIKNKDSRLEEAYQRVAFYRGLELFKNLEIEASIDMFDKSLKYEKYNRTFRARAVYWRGEGWYRLADYNNARADFELFMGIPGAMLLSEYSLVRYNLGYALFNLKDYSGALNHLKTFESNTSDIKPEVLADARNRIADCYFFATDYQMAISYYDKVIDYGMVDADYALFQKGFSMGLIKNERGKVDILSSLAIKYPSSSYIPNAIFERGRTYVTLEDYSRGEADFNTVISTYQSSQFVPRAIVQLGLLYYNLGENDKAIAQFKKVIENHKSTPEARYAMTGLRNAYVDINEVEKYFTYIKTLDGYGDVNLAEKDSLLYTSGENLYMTARCDKATDIFKSYLNEFPNGSFKQNAQYYLAECLMSSGKNDEALKLYLEVTNEPNNQFMEQSLIAVSSIYYSNEDYDNSLIYYEKLESIAGNDENRLIALKGELRSASQVGDASKTTVAAGKIISSNNIPEELVREATFMRAKANYSLNNFEEALVDFRKVGKEVISVEGAESKYRVAELQYKKDLLIEAEKELSEFIEQNSPHQYWMGRVFLLLADISIKKGDSLQARATLQSLVEYYTVNNDGILDEVRAKLETLNEVRQ